MLLAALKGSQRVVFPFAPRENRRLRYLGCFRFQVGFVDLLLAILPRLVASTIDGVMFGVYSDFRNSWVQVARFDFNPPVQHRQATGGIPVCKKTAISSLYSALSPYCIGEAHIALHSYLLKKCRFLMLFARQSPAFFLDLFCRETGLPPCFFL